MVDKRARQIFAYSGVLGDSVDRVRNFELTEHALSLAPRRGRRLQVCYLPTAVGDSPEAITAKRKHFAERRPEVNFTVLTLFTQPNVSNISAHLLGQDVILVEGGSVVNMMAVWQVHNVPAILRRCWDAGIVLAGASAGSLCWHQGGATDSWGDQLAPFTNGLGFLPYSNNVHDDLAEQPRHRYFRQLVADGTLAPGYACPGGVGLHYIESAIHEAVSIVPNTQAWYVDRATGYSNGTAVATRYLPPHA